VDFRTDSLDSLARSVRDGDVSARELVRHALDRIEALDPALNAFVVVDADRALAEAGRLDERQAAGEEVGALAGIPFAVKDLEDVAGLPTTNGSLVVTGADEAETDSVLVARLKLAGAIVVGKTNTPEHGWTAQTFNARFGTTRNPWDPERTPGGSSGGSAAAVAAGMVPLATGSDGGGSLRIPSALCGLAGFKPSPGRVPAGGLHPPGWPLLSTRGTMGWRVPDLAASLDVVLGPDPTELRSLPTPEVSWRHAIDDPGVPMRVVWSPTLGYATVDREVLELCRRGVDALADLGAEVIEQDVVFDEDPMFPWIKLVSGYMQRTFAGVRHTDAWQQVTPGLREQLEGSEGLTVVDFVQAADAAHLLNLRLVDLFAHSRLLVTPTVAGQTPLCGGQGTIDGVEVLNWVEFTYPFNMTGSPAGTICVGRTRAGLPVGLQLIGPQHGDVGVLRAMAALETAIGFDERPDTRALLD
jgi:aspartyl-tRNA(Asn)/glutamyl-tRNA(Gln) amidotransferase subunit A